MSKASERHAMAIRESLAWLADGVKDENPSRPFDVAIHALDALETELAVAREALRALLGARSDDDMYDARDLARAVLSEGREA